jgi:hypothetical protein
LLGRDSGQDALQLDEAPRPRREVPNDQQRPLIADEIERARVGRPLVVRMPLGWRDGRDGGLLTNSRRERQNTGSNDCRFGAVDIGGMKAALERGRGETASSLARARCNEYEQRTLQRAMTAEDKERRDG